MANHRSDTPVDVVFIPKEWERALMPRLRGKHAAEPTSINIPIVSTGIHIPWCARLLRPRYKRGNK